MSTSDCSATIARITSPLLIIVGLAIVASAGCQMAADGQNLQGVRSFQQGQYDTAMQSFQKAVANDPKNADAYYNMAATMHRMGVARNDQAMLSQAETLYNQCLDLDGNHTDCYRGLAVLLVETGRSDRAFNLLKGWAVRSPNVADARVELARLYEEFGDTKSAEIHLTEALHIDQQDPRTWNALARLREQSGDYTQALANYQRAYGLNQFQPEVAERIAALNRTINTGGGPTTPGAGDTRTVNAGTGTVR